MAFTGAGRGHGGDWIIPVFCLWEFGWNSLGSRDNWRLEQEPVALRRALERSTPSGWVPLDNKGAGLSHLRSPVSSILSVTEEGLGNCWLCWGKISYREPIWLGAL